MRWSRTASKGAPIFPLLWEVATMTRLSFGKMDMYWPPAPMPLMKFTLLSGDRFFRLWKK